jgi:hypothetical protein
MATKNMTYTLDDINSIIFNGFDYNLDEKILEAISKIALQVGSPSYVKTPVFKKRDNSMKSEFNKESAENMSASGGGKARRGRGKIQEVSEDDWENMKSFQTKKNEENQVDNNINNIRAHLNKLTDKNYSDILNKIIEVIDKIVDQDDNTKDMNQCSSIIFDIASNNRFYSKLYADLYCELSKRYQTMMTTFENNFSKFVELFDKIEYVDPKVDYDKFCEININNEKRKSLSSLYINLMYNGIVDKGKIMEITRNFIDKIYTFINVDNKKNEVDEITENVIILYKKEMYEEYSETDYERINGYTINEIIERIANSKVKDYKSLTNKSLFKFMDLIDM